MSQRKIKREEPKEVKNEMKRPHNVMFFSQYNSLKLTIYSNTLIFN